MNCLWRWAHDGRGDTPDDVRRSAPALVKSVSKRTRGWVSVEADTVSSFHPLHLRMASSNVNTKQT